MNKTELANIALGHIGSALIQSVDENSPAAQHIRRMWDLTRDGLLRQRDWNFAIQPATLSRLAEDPPFGRAAAYQLPADYIKTVEFNGKAAGTGEADFDIEGGKLLSDDTEKAELRYVRRVEDVSQWDSSFCEAFTYKLAAAIAPALSSSQGLADNMTQKGEQMMIRAFGPDNLETRPRAVLAQTGSGWLAAREGAYNW